MNALKHSELSVKRYGGEIDDYYKLHFYLDSTKELCSDNRHRILHNMWGIRNVIIPIFGKSLINSDGKVISVKDICEKDHVLPDYSNRFIPTLNDFTRSISLPDNVMNKFDRIFSQYSDDSKISKLMLSPLFLTGKKNSLIITHNSWFILKVLPEIFKENFDMDEVNIPGSTIFDHMEFKMWMDNGRSYPPSYINQ